MSNLQQIKYDVMIDIKILNTVLGSKNQVANITDLRNNAVSYSLTLDEHLANMVRWELITDERPEGNGKARRISLQKPYDFCLHELLRLRTAIETINEFF